MVKSLKSCYSRFMPSGKTHDYITFLLALPTFLLARYLTFSLENSLTIAIAITIAMIFGGLMFGPDLDINSRQYQRWGPLRICWWPYKVIFKHRSPFTHGILLGTIIRIIYFLLVVALVYAVGLYLRELFYGGAPSGELVLMAATGRVGNFFRLIDQNLLLAIFLGLWWGAASHTISDLVVSALKQAFKSL